MKLLYIYLLLIFSYSLQGQNFNIQPSIACEKLCGTDEKCLCNCFFQTGQQLRKAEMFQGAIEHFNMALRLCQDALAQTIIDTIRRQEQRLWVYEGCGFDLM